MIHNTQHMPAAVRYGLAFQHLMAVFLGTLFVPIVLGLPIYTSMFFSGVATLLFHYFTYGKLPLYLSTSFTVLAGLIFIRQTALARGIPNDIALCYVCFGSFIVGVIYMIAGQLVRLLPRHLINRLFSTALAGPIIIILGIDMLTTSTHSFMSDWIAGSIAIIAAAIAQFFLRGMSRIMSINIGIAAGVIAAALRGNIPIDMFDQFPWMASPFEYDFMAFRILEHLDWEMLRVTVVTVIPLSFIAIGEHLSDIIAISRSTQVEYMHAVGLRRTISANGLTTILAAVFGASPNTAYTQTTGLIELNKICDARILRMTAIMMIVLSFCPKLTVIVGIIPPAVIAAITIIMYLMVMLVGWRTLRQGEGKRWRKRTIGISIGIIGMYIILKTFCNAGIPIGSTYLSPLNASFILGLILNIAIPQNNEKGKKEHTENT